MAVEDNYDDNEYNEHFEDWNAAREDMMTTMLRNVKLFNSAVDNAAIGVGELYDEVHSEDEIEAAGLILMQLLESLDILAEEVRVALIGLSGFHEPVPTDEVEDFEQSVLTTLGKLDTISDEEVHRARVERYKDRILSTGFGL